MDLFEETIRANCEAAIQGILEEFALRELGVPDRVSYLVPGDLEVWDSGCSQLTGRLSTLTPHTSGSSRPAVMTPCSIDYWVITVNVVLTTCITALDNQGQSPTPAQITGDGVKLLNYTGAMLRAITQLEFVDNVTLWTPQTPQGGVGATGWNFTFKVDSTPCD